VTQVPTHIGIQPDPESAGGPSGEGHPARSLSVYGRQEKLLNAECSGKTVIVFYTYYACIDSIS